MSKGKDLEIAEAIAETTKELELAKQVVRDLANELSDVVDIIEPALADQTKRLRSARMASIDELRQISMAIRDLSETLLSPKTELVLNRAERFVKLMSEIEEFRAVGAFEAFVRAFATEDAPPNNPVQ